MASYTIKFTVDPVQAAAIMETAKRLSAPPYYIQEDGDTVFDFESRKVDPFDVILKHPTGCDVRPGDEAVGCSTAPPPPQPIIKPVSAVTRSEVEPDELPSHKRQYGPRHGYEMNKPARKIGSRYGR